MKTRHVVIATIVMIAVIVIGCVYYMYNDQPSTTNSTTKPPRTNLTKVMKGSAQFEKVNPDPDITQDAQTAWPNLIALVKDITGKSVSLCIDMPSKILTSDGIFVPGSSINILVTNINYVTKSALNVAAENKNFYDITALFFESMKVQSGKLQSIKTTYVNGFLSTVSIIEREKDGPWSIGFFSSILPPSISMPAPSQVGNDADLMSFLEKMIPFYNLFIPTLSAMDQSISTFDVNMFCKLISCLQVYKMINPKIRYTEPFVCTSK